MITSMTGYGKGNAGNSSFSADVEVKSVNSRFLEISLKTPSILSNKEYELREFIRSKMKRGKVSVIINLKTGGDENGDLNMDPVKLKNYISMLRQIKNEAGLSEKIKLEHFVLNKDIFLSNDHEFSEAEFNVVKESLGNALDELLKMKRDEGNELAVDLKKRIAVIETTVNEIEAVSQSSVEEYFEKLKEKVKTLIQDISTYSDRLELELALIAEKAEITEECVRLKSHLKFFTDSIANEDEPGRKLNFLCQEMNREANTISSKSISTVITHHAVQIKEEIEKIREQIQNIE